MNKMVNLDLIERVRLAARSGEAKRDVARREGLHVTQVDYALKLANDRAMGGGTPGSGAPAGGGTRGRIEFKKVAKRTTPEAARAAAEGERAQRDGASAPGRALATARRTLRAQVALARTEIEQGGAPPYKGPTQDWG